MTGSPARDWIDWVDFTAGLVGLVLSLIAASVALRVAGRAERAMQRNTMESFGVRANSLVGHLHRAIERDDIASSLEYLGMLFDLAHQIVGVSTGYEEADPIRNAWRLVADECDVAMNKSPGSIRNARGLTKDVRAKLGPARAEMLQWSAAQTSKIKEK